MVGLLELHAIVLALPAGWAGIFREDQVNTVVADGLW